ncbi:MAG: hypothetical protein JRJ09_11825 [Deltaproteobacteria bacterium]|nr:hypothetical protein [Deltaproteobacteria bacterium]MBW2049197.1 hypothetical protein [Deltaproteobacteria bacterium]MBW2112546.1 hypothetical protein [Deltaproteobacteria bacterium]MBW2353894.1 hypothetical protein [Deltaproteobacteria bacterium]
MKNSADPGGSDEIIATIGNRDDKAQNVQIRYLRDENAFVTSGIRLLFREREILIPAELVVVDFHLMGAIVSAILERLSQARDMETTFQYEPRFQVLDKTYSLEEWGEYVRLTVVE